MPSDIAKLSSEILRNPEKVEIAAQGKPIEKIEQRVYYVNASSKRQLLSHLLSDAALERVIVFTRTKRGANRVAEALEDRGVRSEAIHGNKSQNARQKALDNFSRGKARVLVATDLASRGIDVQGVTHVINYELPADAESYVHRIGRTARAGASGIAVSFCDSSERGQLRSIEKLTRQPIAVVATPANEDMPVMPVVARTRDDRDDRDERGRDERPRGRGPGGPGRPRSFGDRPRSFGDRPNGPPRGPRPHGDRPHGDRPHGDRPQGDRPQGERQWSRGDFRDRPQVTKVTVLRVIVRRATVRARSAIVRMARRAATVLMAIARTAIVPASSARMVIGRKATAPRVIVRRATVRARSAIVRMARRVATARKAIVPRVTAPVPTAAPAASVAGVVQPS